ncbi:hypothetical protein GCM10020000_76100 [Streptomyces olivoverticillatus]
MTDFPARTLRIGTRSSPMALAQVEQVSALLRKYEPELKIDVVPVTTEADKWQGDLAQLGGKGLYVKEIDTMLQRGDVDMAVHCVKDVPGDQSLPHGLIFAAYLLRDDVRDVLLFPEGSDRQTLDDLPPGAIVATSAVRRKAQINRVRPDLSVVRVRGAVGSRVEKLDGKRKADAELDAMVLATSGLERLGIAHRGRQVFSVDEMLPAVGSGTCHWPDQRAAVVRLTWKRSAVRRNGLLAYDVTRCGPTTMPDLRRGSDPCRLYLASDLDDVKR